MKLTHVVLTLVLVASLISCQKKDEGKAEKAAAEAAKPNKVLNLTEVTTVMTVKEIDLPNRLFVLEYDDGNVVALQAADDLENIDKIKVGDKVEVTYFKSEAVYVTAPDAERPPVTESQTVQVDTKDGKPRKVTVKITERTSTVEAINYQTRDVTIKDPDGKVSTITVKPDVKNLENVKVGDQVVLQVTEAVAVDIRKVE
ncbi:MAG TPA: hypothetical protein EYP36_11530 [Calditrichaeota bacterium]|nr:hypothetical protein [Calditrichota bacterium]